MKKIIIPVAIVVVLIGNEIVTLAALVALMAACVGKLFLKLEKAGFWR